MVYVNRRAEMAQDEIEFRGEVVRVTYYNEENGFFIIKCVEKGKRRDDETAIKGKAAVMPAEGQDIYVRGVRKAGSWGLTLEARVLEFSRPSSKTALLLYLESSLKGVGKGLAKTLVEKWGMGIFEVLENRPNDLKDVKGVGKKKYEDILSSYGKAKEQREVVLFLNGLGFSSLKTQKIIKFFEGRNLKKEVEKNPYLLTKVWGIGFRQADEAARQLAVPLDSPFRIQAGLAEVMGHVRQEGSCGIPREGLIEHGAELLGLKVELVEPEVSLLLERGTLIELKSGDLPVVYDKELWDKEKFIARFVLDHLRQVGKEGMSSEHAELLIDRVVEEAGGPIKKLEGSQRAAVHMVLKSKVSILTGGPGAGKTTVTRLILDVLDRVMCSYVGGQFREGSKPRVAVCAPTGKAAQRASEATGRPATTVHRLLEVQGEGKFKRNQSYPLDVDVLVVDESSMLDVGLMASLLAAVPYHAVVLMVGDPDQLPSVGAGKVLRDLIESECVPNTHLDVTYRQDSLSFISKAAYAINGGNVPKDYRQMAGCDYFHLKREYEEEATDEEKRVVREQLQGDILKVIAACEEKGGLDPIRDVQVLAPMRMGLLGTEALNVLLQAKLNPPVVGGSKVEVGEGMRRGVFRVGDKVMQIKNNYDLNVFNGEVGFIVQLEFIEGVVEPDKPKGPPRVLVHVEFDEGVKVYEKQQLDELRLAYAFTIHKSQGSEFKAVVLALDTSHFMMLKRNLFYTGVTRAKKRCYVVGPTKAQLLAVKTVQEDDRWTTLRYHLRTMGGFLTE